MYQFKIDFNSIIKVELLTVGKQQVNDKQQYLYYKHALTAVFKKTTATAQPAVK